MGWKRSCLESLVYSYSLLGGGGRKKLPADPEKIFVLRNNDIGDLLVVTPIFEALKRRFPRARIIAGIGDWNREVLQNNPWIDEILSINAPWHNKFSGKNLGRLRRFFHTLAYVARSPEVVALRREKVSVAIDVLGSWEGALLFMRADISASIGVDGYGGGHLSSTTHITHDPDKLVAQAALDQARLLGVTEFPDVRPQLFLTGGETMEAGQRWDARFTGRSRKIVICPGGGFPEKCRTAPFFREFVRHLHPAGDRIAILGSAHDAALGEALARDNPGVENWCGLLSLRQSFAVISACDVVVCHGSMAQHAAAAFGKPTLLLLTEAYNIADYLRLWGYPFPCVTMGTSRGETVEQQVAAALAGLAKALSV